MRLLLTHKGYQAWAQPVGNELWAMIKEPGRRVVIADVPAVSAAAGDRALKPLAKAAIERDLQSRR